MLVNLLFHDVIFFPTQVNVLGLCICNREFMTQLKERGVNEGHLFLINRYVYTKHTFMFD